MNKEIVLSSLDETKQLAEKLASFLTEENNYPISIHLSGDLGTGKTTLVKEVLNCLGIENFINSPTFTLIEPYEINDLKIFHIDLYRVEKITELSAIGLEEYLQEANSVTDTEQLQHLTSGEVMQSASVYINRAAQLHFGYDVWRRQREEQTCSRPQGEDGGAVSQAHGARVAPRADAD